MMATLVMVRKECCEAFRTTGVRCSICPCRPENRELLHCYQREAALHPLGRRLGCCPAPQASESARAARRV
jgi:hypothetical protein